MKIISTMIGLFFSVSLFASPINKIVTFGDSLSDTGNFYEHMDKQFPTYPYYDGRFTNGPVWIELLAEEKSIALENYAYGGAGILEPGADEESAVFNLRKEVNDYLAEHDDKVDENALYVMWIGANNYLALPEDNEQVLQTVINGTKTELIRLAEKGAKRVMVVNQPDLGITPAAYMAEENTKLSVLAVEHNVRLQQEIEALKGEYPETEWLLLNVADMFYDLFMHPENYEIDLEKLPESCIGNFPPKEKPEDIKMLRIASLTSMMADEGDDEGQDDDEETNQNPCKGYLFFDMVHPTAYVHGVLSNKASEYLQESGVDFDKPESSESSEPTDEPTEESGEQSSDKPEQTDGTPA